MRGLKKQEVIFGVLGMFQILFDYMSTYTCQKSVTCTLMVCVFHCTLKGTPPPPCKRVP